MPTGFIIHWGMEAAKEKHHRESNSTGSQTQEKGEGKHTGPWQLRFLERCGSWG